ncbi:MAG: FAD-dependent oxidoreductase [Verrucomicrobiota bacterium]
MSEQETFHYHTLDEIRQRVAELKLDLEFSEDLTPLLKPVTIGGFKLPNRFVVLPMEGCDGNADGSPDELTIRRYHRFASGGAGLLWVEATAIVQECRANPRQIWLHAGTVDAFARMVDLCHKSARERFGPAHRPLLLLQLTHSGRYSKPGRAPAPIIAHHSKYLDATHQLPPDYPLITDDELERLEDVYVSAAKLAKQAGFDGVDIKACHRYLISELLASYTRENSKYGGEDFANRSRFLRNVVKKVKAAVPGLLVSTRMNAHDSMAYPYGFGMDRKDATKADLTEAKELVGFFKEQGAPLINITIGNPYFNPYVNRPFDLPILGAPMPPESPLRGVNRFMNIVKELQQAHPEMAVIGGGYSWLRQFFPHLGAANVNKGHVSLVGLGRMSFAYPDFAADLMEKGQMDPEKVCVACSACTQIMRDGGRTGCVPRDAAIYEPIYKTGRAEAMDTILQMASTCRQCNDPSCMGGCPARVNIPKFILEITQKRFREAYETLREANVLAAVCGYVCPSEALCEGRCINEHYSHTVPIRHLQRWVGRKAVEEGWVAERHTTAKPSGKRVAIIGAGPAGVAAAARLASYGHAVTIFEKASSKGGAVDSVIPKERLPESILQREVHDVLSSYDGLIQVCQINLHAGHTLDQLQAEGFDAVLLATGLSASATGIRGQRPRLGVEGAMEFLARIKRGGKVTGTILVLGGGNTAIDAAVSARKAGAEDVSMIYRRSFAEMPAWPNERDEAINAGVHMVTLTAPVEYLLNAEGRLTGIKVIRTKLGVVDAKGRRSPEPIPGSEHVLPADLIIEAFGQRLGEGVREALPGIRFTDQGLIWTKADRLETSRSGVFAAGDVVNGGTTVVQAVAEGTRAANDIDEFLTAEPVAIVKAK